MHSIFFFSTYFVALSFLTEFIRIWNMVRFVFIVFLSLSSYIYAFPRIFFTWFRLYLLDGTFQVGTVVCYPCGFLKQQSVRHVCRHLFHITEVKIQVLIQICALTKCLHCANHTNARPGFFFSSKLFRFIWSSRIWFLFLSLRHSFGLSLFDRVRCAHWYSKSLSSYNALQCIVRILDGVSFSIPVRVLDIFCYVFI